jgi:lycopene cyclase domain-containing protein
MKHWSYMGMLIFTLCGSGWLEIVLKTGVLRRIKRAALSILPISALFLLWDAYAISKGHWFFDREQMLGITGPLSIPVHHRSTRSNFNYRRCHNSQTPLAQR